MAIKSSVKPGFDGLSIIILLSLIVVGWLMVYAAMYDGQNKYTFLDISTEMGRQTIFLVLSLIVFGISMLIDWKFWNTFAFLIYGASIVLLILVLLIGKEINGSKSWLFFGPIGFQPAEMAKLGTALAVSSYLSFNKNDIKNRKTLITVLGIIFLPVAIILGQPDPGSALVFFSFFILLYRKGLDAIYYILGFSFVAIFILSILVGPLNILIFGLLFTFAILSLNYRSDLTGLGISIVPIIATYLSYLGSFEMGVWTIPIISMLGMTLFLYRIKVTKLVNIVLPITILCIGLAYSTDFAFNKFLKPHQQDRINVWLRPELCDPRGSLYNLINSKMAISSGGFEGKGFLNGEMTKLNYVPEQHTDFIFSTVGEEQGFIGGFSIILLFTLLIIQSIRIAERSRLEFIKNYAYTVAGILFVHFFINIGMTIGLMPVIGIPLPFISKGGTSLISFTLLVGIMIRMDAAKNRI
ncbi:MAG TPA: rod shape-determining protein RodA [Saprospiraceae bacterium]|nr:rod shape-determining protein RodA [Saprospiraceae bacterium]